MSRSFEEGLAMGGVKEAVLEPVARLPEECTWDDVLAMTQGGD
jgi:hypothetical protein